MSEEELKKFFDARGIRAAINHYDIERRLIYYALIGEDQLPALLFIHGAPASMKIYSDFFRHESLLRTFSIYAVDRPGYGLTNGKPVPSIKKQAALIAPLAERIHRVHQPLIVVGGSFGASIACRLVMDYAGLVQGLVLIAPSLSAELDKTFWITPLLQKTFLKNFIPSSYRSATEEKLRHKNELKKMRGLWSNIDIPVVYLQSRHDLIVSPANALFAQEEMKKAPFLETQFFPGWKHNILPAHSPAIINKIMELYGKL